MTVLGRIVIALVIGGAAWLLIGSLLLVLVFRLAARQEESPSSLDCRDARHPACTGCACSCHP